MACLGVAAEYARQQRRHEGPLTDAAAVLQHNLNACLMDAMHLQRTHCSELTVEFTDCVEEWSAENRYNKAPLKCLTLRRAVEDCVVSNPDFMKVKETYEIEIPAEKIGEKGYLKLLKNWKDKTDDEKMEVVVKFSKM